MSGRQVAGAGSWEDDEMPLREPEPAKRGTAGQGAAAGGAVGQGATEDFAEDKGARHGGAITRLFDAPGFLQHGAAEQAAAGEGAPEQEAELQGTEGQGAEGLGAGPPYESASGRVLNLLVLSRNGRAESNVLARHGSNLLAAPSGNRLRPHHCFAPRQQAGGHHLGGFHERSEGALTGHYQGEATIRLCKACCPSAQNPSHLGIACCHAAACGCSVVVHEPQGFTVKVCGAPPTPCPCSWSHTCATPLAHSNEGETLLHIRACGGEGSSAAAASTQHQPSLVKHNGCATLPTDGDRRGPCKADPPQAMTPPPQHPLLGNKQAGPQQASGCALKQPGTVDPESGGTKETRECCLRYVGGIPGTAHGEEQVHCRELSAGRYRKDGREGGRAAVRSCYEAGTVQSEGSMAVGPKAALGSPLWGVPGVCQQQPVLEATQNLTQLAVSGIGRLQPKPGGLRGAGSPAVCQHVSASQQGSGQCSNSLESDNWQSRTGESDSSTDGSSWGVGTSSSEGASTGAGASGMPLSHRASRALPSTGERESLGVRMNAAAAQLNAETGRLEEVAPPSLAARNGTEECPVTRRYAGGNQANLGYTQRGSDGNEDKSLKGPSGVLSHQLSGCLMGKGAAESSPHEDTAGALLEHHWHTAGGHNLMHCGTLAEGLNLLMHQHGFGVRQSTGESTRRQEGQAGRKRGREGVAVGGPLDGIRHLGGSGPFLPTKVPCPEELVCERLVYAGLAGLRGREDIGLGSPLDETRYLGGNDPFPPTVLGSPEEIVCERLVQVATALEDGDLKLFRRRFEWLAQLSDPRGKPFHRMLHYELHGLFLRCSCSGYAAFNSPSHRRPEELMKSRDWFLAHSPLPRFGATSAVKSICTALAGRSCVHVIEFGTFMTTQWVPVMKALAVLAPRRADGTPSLCFRLTQIDTTLFVSPGRHDLKALQNPEATEKFLKKGAEACGVELEYSSVDLDSAHVHTLFSVRRRAHESVACCSTLDLDWDPGHGLRFPGSRDLILKWVASMRPELFVMLSYEVDASAPSFVSRFRSIVKHHLGLLQGFGAVARPEQEDARQVFEETTCAKPRVNMTSCEGAERLVRPLLTRQWRTVLDRVGLVPGLLCGVSSLYEMLKDFPSGFGLAVEKNSIKMTWRGQPSVASSIWVPRGHPSSS